MVTSTINIAETPFTKLITESTGDSAECVIYSTDYYQTTDARKLVLLT